ncbi:MAG: tetratricopeptide repeat protein, partial [Cyanobacteria bacterium P01_C01_bin.118]
MSSRWFRWLIPLWAVVGLTSPALAQDGGFELEDFDFWAEQCLLLSQDTDYEKTLEACETAISLKRKRDNLELWSARSRALFELGQYVEAIGSYNRVLEVAPRESIALTYQCASYVQLSRLDDAMAACEQALAINGNWGTDAPALAWYYHGLALQTMGRLETALGSYGRALRLEPENVTARAGQCSVAAELGYSGSYGNSYQGCSLGESVIAYEQVLAQQPDDVTIWFQQGLALEQLGRYDQALTSYDQAIALVEDYSLALAHQCAVLNQLEEFETALAACDAALAGNGKWDRLGPGYAWSQRSAAQVGTGDYEGALASADRAVTLLPDYPGGWNNRAVSLWHLEALNEATVAIATAYSKEKIISDTLETETFDRSYQESPILFHRRRVFTAFNQGSILLDLGAYSEATIAYRRAESVLADWRPLGGQLVSDQFLAQLWSNFAIALHATGDRSQFWQAGDYAERSTQFATDSYGIWYNSGFIQTAVGNYSLALEALTQATELEPENPDLAIAWYKLGIDAASGYQLPIAWQALQHAAVLTPDNIDIAVKQGDVLVQAGCSQAALQFFELLLNTAPDNTLVAERHGELVAASGSNNAPFVSTSTVDVSKCAKIFPDEPAEPLSPNSPPTSGNS